MVTNDNITEKVTSRKEFQQKFKELFITYYIKDFYKS
jgi:hypothetical protein